VANDSLFNIRAIQQVQLMTFEEEARQDELKIKDLKAAEQREKHIQYALLAFGIIFFVMMFLLLSRSLITNTRVIELLGLIALLIVFEFLNLLLHPFLQNVTNDSPLLMLLALVIIAALLVPMHHRLEKWATAKLVAKNKHTRLLAAKKTIEKLTRV
jgi:NADH:ubiquinone oxidoreductase subunit 6 (subunit J)